MQTGATKGALDRELPHRAMSGTSRVQHAVSVWQTEGSMKSLDLAAAAAHLVLSSDSPPHSARGSLALLLPPPLLAMAASSKATKRELQEVGGAGGHAAD
eukprot:1759267-Alexandrium_andersonii.AAC.1